MQLSIISLIAALAATTSAAVAGNGTSAYYPTGTGAVTATGTSTPVKPTSALPFEGAADRMTGSALGLIIAGGVALML
ncbi:hypothetical protein P153DRAFT_381163 [Dothidotthia symphoricarpi CBS 119687]|uniref:Uncharacterized protein n=1 Tax=Dothidotthia symphoricarpi CBS 119687 TaxID=1392245 RepID=A0A6A6ATW8_9PLEO|nr:uncharacterized protein P153DRAFT_381163 [Dothidotthia symphoricarpi CBS 119687]KAF2133991.1 hypothetical protein P153DRAFT_381163 [Dothidotthia symphoricarpi CBS 119687]